MPQIVGCLTLRVTVEQDEEEVWMDAFHRCVSEYIAAAAAVVPYEGPDTQPGLRGSGEYQASNGSVAWEVNIPEPVYVRPESV